MDHVLGSIYYNIKSKKTKNEVNVISFYFKREKIKAMNFQHQLFLRESAFN